MAVKVIPKSKLTNRQVGKLIELFVLEVPASKAAGVMGVNRHSAERIYTIIRLCLAKECEKESPLGGEVEIDESYFGGRRKGEFGRTVASKVPVFGF